MSLVRFEVVPPVSRPEEPVFLCGNLRALGEWDAARALPLWWNGERHIGEIEAEAGTVLEYKILRSASWEAEAVDAWGNVPPNVRHDVWFDTTLHRTIADWKDRYVGRLTHDRVHSRVLAGWRELLIWLPASYAVEHERRYPVLYFNDGANVFDPETSPLTKTDLAADEWVHLLAGEGAMPEVIVVGVCHPDGFSEGWRSERDIDLSLELGGAAYAQFLATELVPAIDAHYRTLARRDMRAVCGASLGALNAFHAALVHAEVFGRMLGLSTAFGDLSQSPPESCPALRMLEARPAMPDSRFYFDLGTRGLDAGYEPYHRELATRLQAAGWEDGHQFHVLRVIDGTHDEFSWRLRLGDGLRFLWQNDL